MMIYLQDPDHALFAGWDLYAYGTALLVHIHIYTRCQMASVRTHDMALFCIAADGGGCHFPHRHRYATYKIDQDEKTAGTK